MSELRFQNKAHALCSKLFLRVAHLCQIFGYLTRHTKCVVSCFFGSLGYVRSSLTEQNTLCVVSYFFGSVAYVRSSLTEQGKRSVKEVVSSGRSVMSDLRLQKKAQEVCSKLFLWVAHLCQIFAYRIRHTACAMRCFFGSLTYLRSSVTKQLRHTKCVVSSFFGSLSYVRSSLTEQGTRCV